MKIRKAIIPAAGMGTRFLPATKAMPKEMLPIVDKPTIQYIVEEAVASGIEDIIIVTGKSKRAIEDHFDNSFELEHNLAEQHKWSCWMKCANRLRWQTFTTFVKANRLGLVMRYGVPVNLLAMNPLPSC